MIVLCIFQNTLYSESFVLRHRPLLEHLSENPGSALITPPTLHCYDKKPHSLSKGQREGLT